MACISFHTATLPTQHQQLLLRTPARRSCPRHHKLHPTSAATCKRATSSSSLASSPAAAPPVRGPQPYQRPAASRANPLLCRAASEASAAGQTPSDNAGSQSAGGTSGSSVWNDVTAESVQQMAPPKLHALLCQMAASRDRVPESKCSIVMEQTVAFMENAGLRSYHTPQALAQVCIAEQDRSL